MCTALKYLGIVQLSPSLLLLKQKISQETFHNSPAIPSATDSEYRIQWGTPDSLVEELGVRSGYNRGRFCSKSRLYQYCVGFAGEAGEAGEAKLNASLHFSPCSKSLPQPRNSKTYAVLPPVLTTQHYCMAVALGAN